MPYISPKGAISRSAPSHLTSRGQAADLKSTSTPESSAANTPSEADNAVEKTLYMIDSEDLRPVDPKVVHEMDKWDGWHKENECPGEEPDVDPLAETEHKSTT